MKEIYIYVLVYELGASYEQCIDLNKLQDPAQRTDVSEMSSTLRVFVRE